MELLRTEENRYHDLIDYPFVSHYTDIEGLRIHYLDEGPKASPPVLLLHGVPSWSYLYRKIIPLLAGSGFRLIAPDLAGFGKSDKPIKPDWYNISNHAKIIKKLIEKLDLKEITLFGQDWGSIIGLRAAMDDPDRYSGLIISNGGLPIGETRPPIAFSLWKLFSRLSPWFPIDRIINAGMIKKLSEEEKKAYRAPFPGRNHKLAPRTMPSKVPVKANDPEATLNIITMEKLMQWKKPFLTIFGDSDPITKGWEKIFQNNIPGALHQKHTIIKAGHFIQEDAPLVLAEIIITFIRDNTADN